MFDQYNFNTETWKQLKRLTTYKEVTDKRRDLANEFGTYEIMMPIDSSLFYSNNFLPSNTPLELSFERAKSCFSIILGDDATTSEKNGIPNVLDLDDVYLLIPFTKHVKTQDLEKKVSRPIKIKYDEYVINRFNLSTGSANIRIPNALYGPFPRKLFWGLMDMSSYTGSYESSSTKFEQHRQTKASVYVDGNMLSGYPVTMSAHAITQPYQKFLENTNKFLNCYSGQTMTPQEYRWNFIHSASFDKNNNGTITFDFDFFTALQKDLVLITCSVFDRKLELDKDRNFHIK